MVALRDFLDPLLDHQLLPVGRSRFFLLHIFLLLIRLNDIASKNQITLLCPWISASQFQDNSNVFNTSATFSYITQIRSNKLLEYVSLVQFLFINCISINQRKTLNTSYSHKAYNIQSYSKLFILCGFITKRRLRTCQRFVGEIVIFWQAPLFEFLGLH
jgi:hypothetical protein